MTLPNADPPAARVSRGGPGAVVPAAEVRTYYDKPVIKAPVWTWEVPWYVFFGGLSGASAVLAAAGDAGGRRQLANVARRIGLGALIPSPLLLIADLGRPERFHHMLRVFKPTSPMSMGSWTLVAFSAAQGGATVLAELNRLPRLRAAAQGAAAALGSVMSTYTGVLFADTAVPVWHEARRELPFVFGAGSAASAGSAVLLAAGDHGGAARRVALGAAVTELAAAELMVRQLGDLGEPYELGDAGRFAKAAKALLGTGATLLGLARRRRSAQMLGAALVLGGAACERWAVYRAGFISAHDPKYTVAPQRARVQTQRSTS